MPDWRGFSAGSPRLVDLDWPAKQQRHARRLFHVRIDHQRPQRLATVAPRYISAW